MNDKTTDNIVEMTSYKQNMNSINSGSLELLNECRDVMTDRLSQTLSVVLNTADDILFDLVQKSGPSEHHFYFNAMREVRLKRTSIETGFKENFVSIYNKSISTREMNGDPATGKGSDKEVDIEEAIALSATVGKIRHDCHDALFSLDQRMGELLSSVKVEKRQNPVRPETVCNAFQEACQEIDSGIEIKLILFKLFEKYITSGLHTAYADIDSLLTKKKSGSQSKMDTGLYIQADAPDAAQQKARQNSGIIKDKNYFIVANRIIKNEISQHINKGTMPEFVRDFMFNHWSKLLLKIYIKEGVDSGAWLHAVDVIDDLVNCISNETLVSDRLKCEQSMPNLIQRLKFGMNVIPVTPAIREEFIAELKRYHQEQVKVAREHKTEKTVPPSEDITIPSFRKGGGKIPFTDELFADNKPGKKNEFDID